MLSANSQPVANNSVSRAVGLLSPECAPQTKTIRNRILIGKIHHVFLWTQLSHDQRCHIFRCPYFRSANFGCIFGFQSPCFVSVTDSVLGRTCRVYLARPQVFRAPLPALFSQTKIIRRTVVFSTALILSSKCQNLQYFFFWTGKR